MSELVYCAQSAAQGGSHLASRSASPRLSPPSSLRHTPPPQPPLTAGPRREGGGRCERGGCACCRSSPAHGICMAGGVGHRARPPPPTPRPATQRQAALHSRRTPQHPSPAPRRGKRARERVGWAGGGEVVKGRGARRGGRLWPWRAEPPGAPPTLLPPP
eukprot:922013-Rhodomonas_salina.1